jgi:CheY-like chemotaxis protein
MDRSDHTSNNKSCLKILLVDDEAISQCITEANLSRAGYKHIDTAINGKEALAKTNKRQYNLIITDVWMPKLDGIEFTKKLRQSKNKNTQTPIIAITSDQTTSTKNNCLAAGITDVAYKPTYSNVLDQSIQRIISIQQ